jgi:hypothetical protein
MMHSVLGSVLLGWSSALLLVVLGPFRRGEHDGWRILAGSVVAWFVPDKLMSISYGFWQNAVLNLGVALLYAIPLAATYRTFHRTPL